MSILSISTVPQAGMKPGTSGLRKKVTEFSRLIPQNFTAGPAPSIGGQFGGGGPSSTPPPPKPAVNVAIKKKVTLIKVKNDEDERGSSPDLAALLEQACADLNYSLEQIEQILSSGQYPEELIALLLTMSGIRDTSELVDKLKDPRSQLLKKVQDLTLILSIVNNLIFRNLCSSTLR